MLYFEIRPIHSYADRFDWDHFWKACDNQSEVLQMTERPSSNPDQRCGTKHDITQVLRFPMHCSRGFAEGGVAATAASAQVRLTGACATLGLRLALLRSEVTSKQFQPDWQPKERET